MQTAWEAIHTKDTFYAGLFQRLKPKIKAKGAAWAVAHRMAKVIWLILHEEVEAPVFFHHLTAPADSRTQQCP